MMLTRNYDVIFKNGPTWNLEVEVFPWTKAIAKTMYRSVALRRYIAK